MMPISWGIAVTRPSLRSKVALYAALMTRLEVDQTSSALGIVWGCYRLNLRCDFADSHTPHRAPRHM